MITVSTASLLEKTHKVKLDKSYLWEVRILNWGNRYELPLPPFEDWFPCTGVQDPFWNIMDKDFVMSMTSVSIPENIGKMNISISGIIDHIDKCFEMWLRDWYDQYHFQGGSPFHHVATIHEIARKIEIKRLDNSREKVFSNIYYVTLQGEQPIQLSNNSTAKEMTVNFNVVGRERSISPKYARLQK